MNKSSYINSVGVKKTDEEINEAADKNDATYTQDYSDRPLNFENYLQIRPNRKAVVPIWPEFIQV